MGLIQQYQRRTKKGRFVIIPNFYRREGRQLAKDLRKRKLRKKRKQLGEGWQAKVYQQNAVAVRKEFKKYPFSSRRKKVDQEVTVLRRLRRTGVAPKLLGRGDNYVDMELIPGQSLRTKVAGSDRRQRKYGKMLARKVNRMHKARVMHRDLHDGNILVTKSGSVKILDYGQAKVQNRPLTTRERQKDINRVLRSHRGKQYETLRNSFVNDYRYS